MKFSCTIQFACGLDIFKNNIRRKKSPSVKNEKGILLNIVVVENHKHISQDIVLYSK